MSELLTTASVPTKTSDGALLWETICEMKFAAMPMMASSEMACRIRTTLKVDPRAPAGPAMMVTGTWCCGCDFGSERMLGKHGVDYQREGS